MSKAAFKYLFNKLLALSACSPPQSPSAQLPGCSLLRGWAQAETLPFQGRDDSSQPRDKPGPQDPLPALMGYPGSLVKGCDTGTPRSWGPSCGGPRRGPRSLLHSPVGGRGGGRSPRKT